MKFIGTLFLLILSFQGDTVIASTNSNPNPPSNSHSQSYCLNRQISFDADSFQVDGETESVNFYHDNAIDTDNDTTTTTDAETDTDTDVAAPTSTITDNVATFFHGTGTGTDTGTGDRQLDNSSKPFIAMGECSLVSFLQDELNRDHLDFDEENDDDDDDDDDNDGHSSMLSNTSIRQRVTATATATATHSYLSTTGYYDNSNGQNSLNKNRGLNMNSRSFPRNLNNGHRRRSSFMRNSIRHIIHKHGHTSSPQSSSSLSKLLGVRGGAASGGSVVADEFAKRLIAAATVTVLYEGMIGHILEFLKIAMQTAPVGTATYVSIIQTITEEKGLAGLWDGFVPWGIVQSICKGGVFGLAYAMAKTYLKPLVDKGLLPQQVALTMAGGIAGGFQGFVLSPLLLLKTRVMTNPVFRENISLMRTISLSLMIGLEVVKNEGIFALMKGADVFALKRVFDWSTRYYFSDLFQSLMVKSGLGVNGVLSPPAKIAASLLSGTASTIVTLPLDVIVAKSQDAKKAGVKVSAWETFMKDFKVGGMKGLYDANMMGFEARLLHVCLTTVVMQFGSPLMFDFMFGNIK